LEELEAKELNSQKEQRVLKDTHAVNSQRFCAGRKDGKVIGIDGKQAYFAWRRSCGSPDDGFPPKSAEQLSISKTNKKLELE
jgi:hypothetical protein